ncbi:hypothetical protein IT402_02125 [Candidatus Nomurabacteria bacterium]|nr:hypothetical protein [Candidatus Nomurabacteria bacterium]
MKFGMEGAPQMHWSKENLKLAINKLEEKPPVFGEDTGEKDGKYFAMGYEVEKAEYDHFINQLNELLDFKNGELSEELEKAA